MAILGKSRLNSSRSEFAEWVSQRKPETQKRYWRAYNSYWAKEYKATGRGPPKPRAGVATRAPSPAGYHREGPGEGAIVKEGGGNRFVIVVRAEYKRGKKREERYYSIIKGNTHLDAQDLEEIIDTVRLEYNVGGGKITLVPVQTIDRWNRSRVVF